MTLPLTHEGYEKLRDSAVDPRSHEGNAVLAAQAMFLAKDLMEVRAQSGAMPDNDSLRALVEPRVDTIRNMLYPLDGFASPILDVHAQFRQDRLASDVTSKLKRDEEIARQQHSRSTIVAAIALRQAAIGSTGVQMKVTQIIDKPLALDRRVEAEYGLPWTPSRLGALYDINPYALLNRTQDERAILPYQHYQHILPVAAFGYRSLKRARRLIRTTNVSGQLAA